jgi:poly-gamma-glutamate capsule biosynthesis protein CapA/YwtB (metallophosphatase superfamily)
MPEMNDKSRQRQGLRSDRRQLLHILSFAALGAVLQPHWLLHAQEKGANHTTDMNKRLVTLFLCGDVMTGRGIDQILPHPADPRLYEQGVKDARVYVELAERLNGSIARPVDFAYIWGDALAELERRAPDVRIINLETAVTTSEAYWPKGINYRMHPANIPCLTVAAVDCCVLANNHVLDWGPAGLEETLATLTKAGLKYAGADRTLDKAQAPAVIDVPSRGRVVVLSFGTESSGIGRDWGATADRPGVNLLSNLSDVTVSAIAEQVQRVKQAGDVVVASIHWGGNWGYTIGRKQRQFAHALIDAAGIDVVHGHSSHHVKGIEVYKERPIIYGCGDFLNDYEGISGYEAYRDDLGLMYFPSLDPANGRLQRFDMTPTRIRNLRINRASRKEAQWLADVLNRESKPLGTRVSLDEENRLALHWSGR